MSKYSIILGNLGNTCDRFLSSGYKDELPKETLIRQASEIEGVKGVELVGTWDVSADNVDKVGEMLAKYGLKCVSIIPDHFSQKRWGRGSLSAKDADIRKQALEYTFECVEMARKLDCSTLNIWPGQDGYDYILQSHLIQERSWLLENIKAVAKASPDIKFALEYKPKEPRNYCFMARASDTLLLAKETGMENVGVCIDTGHAFVAGENVAESIVILQEYGRKLFHMHFNDNYGGWDDDMIVGSVHFPVYVETLFWLKETAYDGWLSMDQYPYREDGQGALRESVEFLKMIEDKLTEGVMEEIRSLVTAGDAVSIQRWLRKTFFK
ncbi:Xylose isomerase [bioreactor metagenome]|jgi:sugar phosphate isomerase/epimerase|uniref:Xylose isomerase n=1 Tax=bioreactor metagenome TaxID=1076179 RepID=A0A644Y623_9ZZZZ|nr:MULTISPECIES: sugar phosphate isomerase/epimerase family protein [Sphaerochaeta]MDT3359730.1 sugar phosphate isomerase/epimerase [Spirochaetota bacterium]MDX9985764.1 sugar phosphate isomerase/epimerase family protein [Sphaerochaeta sp.]MEA5027976.1 sugar phosphate isomerase/epimerase family protein [Sphaerochaeta associata]NCB97090.1 sugar phosphate isomerase/epimerase [Bacteroidia bacterium]